MRETAIEEVVEWNWCHAGIKTHYWYLYFCETKGTVQNNKLASKSIDWYNLEEIAELEPVWKYWLEKIFEQEKTMTKLRAIMQRSQNDTEKN